MKNIINFDKSANMRKHKCIKEEIYKIIDTIYNPNSKHILGQTSTKLIENSKKSFLECFPNYDNIQFIPGGGSMANRRAILGTIPFKPDFINKNSRKDTILISSIEHKSIDKDITSELIQKGYNVIKLFVKKKKFKYIISF